MIYIIYPCPESFFPLDSFCPHSFCPLEILNDLHLFAHVFILSPYYFAPCYFAPGNSLMIFTIYPCPISFFPLDSFCPPPHIILPPGNRLMIYTIYPCPISFFPLDSFCPLERTCLMIYTIYSPCPLSFCLLD